MSRVSCLLDGNRGIYIPRDFAADFRFGPEYWQGAREEDLETLRKGPDEEWYWEAWDSVCQAAVYITPKATKIQGVTYPQGARFHLEQDGDLFLCDDVEDE